MRYLSLSLFAEGPSDHPFLQRIIYRTVRSVAMDVSGDQMVEIAETFVSGDGYGASETSRAERVAASYRNAIAQGAVSLLFIHTDGDGDPNAAQDERISPCCDELRGELQASRAGCVGVVPVRETEAWALADHEALRRELGTRKSLQELGLPADAARIEAAINPKTMLRQVIERARAGRRSRRRSSMNPEIPAGLGDRADLDQLRKLSAFRAFENETETTLRRMWFGEEG